jgi:hypothetical protein
MRHSGIRATALAAIALAGPLLGACIGGGDCFKPADAVIQSAVGPGGGDDRIVQLGSCGLWVKLEEDGSWYTAFEPDADDMWTFTEADLVAAGAAHEVSIPMFALRDTTVYAIPDVPLEDGFAMIRGAPAERIVVFTQRLSDSLCLHLARLPDDPTTCLGLRAAGPSAS